MYFNSEFKKIHVTKIKDYKHFFISVNCESSLYIPWKVNNHLKTKSSSQPNFDMV